MSERAICYPEICQCTEPEFNAHTVCNKCGGADWRRLSLEAFRNRPRGAAADPRCTCPPLEPGEKNRGHARACPVTVATLEEYSAKFALGLLERLGTAIGTPSVRAAMEKLLTPEERAGVLVGVRRLLQSTELAPIADELRAEGAEQEREKRERFAANARRVHGLRPVWLDVWAGEAHREGPPGHRVRGYAPALGAYPGADVTITFRGGEEQGGPVFQILGTVGPPDEQTAGEFNAAEEAERERDNAAARVRLERAAAARRPPTSPAAPVFVGIEPPHGEVIHLAPIKTTADHPFGRAACGCPVEAGFPFYADVAGRATCTASDAKPGPGHE